MTGTNLAGAITVGVVLFQHIIPGVCEPISIVQFTKQVIKMKIDALTVLVLEALDVALANVFYLS